MSILKTKIKRNGLVIRLVRREEHLAFISGFRYRIVAGSGDGVELALCDTYQAGIEAFINA